MPDDIRVYGATVKKELNPDLWNGFRLKDEVRDKLLAIADKFYNFTGTDLSIEDIHVVGSNASYNWTSTSDIDLHLILNFDEFSSEEEKKEVLREKFLAKKRIFNDQYEIEFFGHEIELYVEDVDDHNASNGIYSVLNNHWVRKPELIEPDVNRNKVKKRVNHFKVLIDSLENYDDPIEKFEKSMRIKDEIMDMRHSSLSSGGNFSIGNIAFKTLRNSGYIKKLFDHMNDSYGDSLSLMESVTKNNLIGLIKEELEIGIIQEIEDLGLEKIDEVELDEYYLDIYKTDREYHNEYENQKYYCKPRNENERVGYLSEYNEKKIKDLIKEYKCISLPFNRNLFEQLKSSKLNSKREQSFITEVITIE